MPVGSVEGTTHGATVSTGLFGFDFATNGPTVWYSFVGTGETFVLDMDCGSVEWYSLVRVFGDSCDQHDGETYHQRYGMCEKDRVLDGVTTVPGRQYFVSVEGGCCLGPPSQGGYESGSFTLNLFPIDV